MTRHDPRKPSASKPTARKPAPRKSAPGKPAKREKPATAAPERQRIAKLMARVGLCSRRDAEAWIVDGRVTLNGEILTSPAQDVGPDDRILVDGEPLPEAEKTRLFLFHKPRGLVTSDHDPEGRETVADYLRENWPDGPRVVTIGRLDINTEGLLLLTNDGGLARVLELPATGWVRRYRVRAKGETDQGVLDRLHQGVTIEGVDYAGIEAKLDRIQGANCWLTMGLREGKNREIKRVLEHIGLEVNRLIRLSFGPFQLLDLPEGKVEEVKTRILRDQLGETLAAEAGVDFQDADVAPEMFVQETTILTARDAAIARKRAEHASDDRKTSGAKERKPFGAKAATGRSSADKPRGERGSDRRAPRDDTPEQEPRRERPVAGTRKHVSTLRADETTARREGPRKRIERATTTDRNDRAIPVERMVRSRPEPEKPQASRRGAGRFATRDESLSRDKRPERGRDHASPSAMAKRVRISRSGGAPEREERPRRDAPRDVSRQENRERPTTGFGGKTRSVRPETPRDERPARDDRPRRDGRPTRDGRPARDDRPARPERKSFDSKSFGERPTRPRDGATERPTRRSDEDRPRRDDRAAGRDDRKGARNAGPRNDRKVDGKPSGNRERGGDKPAFVKGPRRDGTRPRDDARPRDGARPSAAKGGAKSGGRPPPRGPGASRGPGKGSGSGPTRGPRPGGKPKR